MRELCANVTSYAGLRVVPDIFVLSTSVTGPHIGSAEPR